MNKCFKLKGIIFLVVVSIISSIIICNFSQTNSKADGTAISRDTKLSLNNNKLEVKRTNIGTTPMGKENSWTIFIYMCGSDLESFYGDATSDINEMIAANTNENVNIVIQTGGALIWRNKDIDATKSNRYLVKDDKIQLLESNPAANMGDYNTLKDFLSWGVSNYAAEHMGVVFWNHGGGSIDGVCFDERKLDDSLNLLELEQAFNNISKNMTNKFEFIGFDACLMSTIELANILAPYSNYMIASEEAEPNIGWNYTPIVNALAQNSDIDTVSLGKVIIDSYFNSLVGEYKYDLATLSLIDLNEIDNILINFNEFCKELNNKTSKLTDLTNYAKVAKNSENYGGNNSTEGYSNMVDLGDFVKNMSSYVSNSEPISSAIQKSVVYHKSETGHKNSTGLAMYYPLQVGDITTYNILRNIAISPYYMEYLDKVLYACKFGSLDKFTSNNWTNSKYYFDDNFNFMAYMFTNIYDYQYKLRGSAYYSNATFDDNWFNWFNKANAANITPGDAPNQIPTPAPSIAPATPAPSENTAPQTVNDYLIDWLESLNQSDLTGPIADWLNSQKSIKPKNNNKNTSTYTSEEYQLVIPNGNTVNVLGSIAPQYSDTNNSTFDGKWFSLADGQFIQAKFLKEGNGLSLYTSPAIVNDKVVTIRFVADNNKNVLVLGTWDGIAKNGKSGKGYRKIDSGSVITPLYTTIDPTTGNVKVEQGTALTASDGKLIVAKNVENYTTIIELIDTFGNVAYDVPNQN